MIIKRVASVCTTSCPMHKLKGVRGGEREGECVHEGDCGGGPWSVASGKINVS